MRLWLSGAFAAVSLITAGAIYALGDRPKAVLVALVLGILAGFLIAVGITHRVTRLSKAAGEMAAGDLETARLFGERVASVAARMTAGHPLHPSAVPA